MILASAGCGADPSSAPSGAQSPLSPSPVAVAQPANFAGEWQVTYHVDACIGRYCYVSQINRDGQLTLRLLQVGDRVTGTRFGYRLAADVQGFVDAAGRVSLTGGAPSVVADVAALEVLRFEATLDPAVGLARPRERYGRFPGL